MVVGDGGSGIVVDIVVVVGDGVVVAGGVMGCLLLGVVCGVAAHICTTVFVV
jgi:hypothetical protein